MIDTSLDSSNFYFLLAVFQGVILSLLIGLFRTGGKKPNIYLSILIFLISLNLLQSILEASIHAFNVKFPIPMSFRLAFGPLAYLHILHIKDPIRKFLRKDLMHFIPSLILDILVFTISFLYLASNMDWAYANIPLIQSIAIYAAFIHIVQLTIYTYLIYKESVNARQVLKEFNRVKKWLSVLIVSWSLAIGFHVIGIPIGLIFIDQLDDNSEWLYIPLNTINAIWIFMLGYSYIITYAKVIGNYMDKIRKFNFSANDLDNKKNALLQALDQQELYKDPRLTVAKLAGHLGWPINSASKMINDTLQTNFNDLINQYRVAAFKELTLHPDSKKYSILGLGQDVGFSSKASFYRVFKKETGMTPSEFMKMQA
ncbi:MAG: AraC family transcriptional regulator [Bacteroidota bacterium]